MGIDIGRIKTAEVQELVDEGRWETYEKDVEVKIRASTPRIVRSLQAKCERWRLGAKVLNEERFEHELRYHMVAEWKGVLDDGKPAECSRANIDAVFDNLIDFAAWIVEKSNQAGRDIEQEVKARRENFPDTSAAPASSSS